MVSECRLVKEASPIPSESNLLKLRQLRCAGQVFVELYISICLHHKDAFGDPNFIFELQVDRAAVAAFDTNKLVGLKRRILVWLKLGKRPAFAPVENIGQRLDFSTHRVNLQFCAYFT